jgi:hypothetical protein
MTVAESSVFAAHALSKRSQSVVVKTTSSKPGGLKKSTKYNRQNRTFFSLGHCWPSEKEMSETEDDNNKLEVTEGMGTSSVVDTTVRVYSMRRSDKWLCNSGASHHRTANKQYLATYNVLSAPVNISLADKGTILVYGSETVNIEMLVEGK